MSDAQKHGDSTYIDRQTQYEREYAAAWENAPPDFKAKASQFGLTAQPPENEGMAMEFNDNYSAKAEIPDMADALDTIVDHLIEKYGQQHAFIIRCIYRDLRKPMNDEIMRNRSNFLSRVAMLLVIEEKGNLLARVHALLHSIPRLSSQAGFPSMRYSARLCGVSPEWLRRKRDGWCQALELTRPTHGIKSDPAKLKYRINALKNHWRNQLYKRSYNYERLIQQQRQPSNGAVH